MSSTEEMIPNDRRLKSEGCTTAQSAAARLLASFGYPLTEISSEQAKREHKLLYRAVQFISATRGLTRQEVVELLDNDKTWSKTT